MSETTIQMTPRLIFLSSVVQYVESFWTIASVSCCLLTGVSFSRFLCSSAASSFDVMCIQRCLSARSSLVILLWPLASTRHDPYHWIFSFFLTICLNPRCVYGGNLKSPVFKILDLPVQSLKSPNHPHSDGLLKLQQVALIVSTCLNALSCCHVPNNKVTGEWIFAALDSTYHYQTEYL